jgi:hypothetical protein
MDVQLRSLEHVALTSPLGVRFWDVVTRDVVRSGLRLSVREVDSPREPKVFPNGSGVWVVKDLWLKRPRAEFPDEASFLASDDFRWGDGRPPFWQRWSTPVTTLEFTMSDGEGRFRPYTFRAPAPQRGFARRACGDGPVDAMPVYPAPTRSAPAGMAVVRAQLVEEPTTSNPRRPAAWARLDVSIGTVVVGRSYADREGRVAVMFPWPAPIDSSLHSPPAGSGGNALINQRWRVRLRAYYDQLPPADTPDLCRVLPQHEVTLLEMPNVTLGERDLEYGRELVVRSADIASPPAGSDLLLHL